MLYLNGYKKPNINEIKAELYYELGGIVFQKLTKSINGSSSVLKEAQEKDVVKKSRASDIDNYVDGSIYDFQSIFQDYVLADGAKTEEHKELRTRYANRFKVLDRIFEEL